MFADPVSLWKGTNVIPVADRVGAWCHTDETATSSDVATRTRVGSNRASNDIPHSTTAEQRVDVVRNRFEASAWTVVFRAVAGDIRRVQHMCLGGAS